MRCSSQLTDELILEMCIVFNRHSDRELARSTQRE